MQLADCRLARLGDHGPHVPRREELALLHVDRLAGARRREQRRSGGRGQRRNLQHVDDLGDRRPPAPASCTSVSTGTPISRLTSARMRSPSSSPGPRNESWLVRLALSNDDLKTNGTPARARDRRQPLGMAQARSAALDHARAGDQHQRGPPKTIHCARADYSDLRLRVTMTGICSATRPWPSARAPASRAPHDRRPDQSAEQRMRSSGRDFNSGWNWQPRNHGWPGSSMISTS